MIAEQVKEIIEVVAGELGVAIEQVYPRLYDQAAVICDVYSAVLWTVGISFAALIASVVGIAIFGDKDSNTSTVALVASACVAVLSGLALLIGGIWALGSLTSYLTALNNPEWWAIEYVLKLIG